MSSLYRRGGHVDVSQLDAVNKLFPGRDNDITVRLYFIS